MTAITDTLVAANEKYATSLTDTEKSLPLPPGKKYAIVTCIDARLHPSSFLGLSLGDAHIIRNAGGSARDALRSLVISQQLLGTEEIVLIKHTDCGMLTFTNDDIHGIIKERLGVDDTGRDYLPFPELERAVEEDVKFLKGEALVKEEVRERVSGWVYEVETGKLRRVA